MKNNEFNKAEEFLRDYIDVIEEAQAAEFAKFLDDEAIARETKIYGRKASTYSQKSNRLVKYVAVFIVVIVIAGVVVPVEEVSAWVVWKFDAIFGEHDDHTEIKPDDVGDFLQYYVGEIPEGFEVISEEKKDGREYIQYLNSEGNYIVFYQMERGLYVNSLDNENRKNHYEIISDFEILVSEGDSDFAFEIVTDKVAILIQTNAGYEIGKEVIENLKEL